MSGPFQRIARRPDDHPGEQDAVGEAGAPVPDAPTDAQSPPPPAEPATQQTAALEPPPADAPTSVQPAVPAATDAPTTAQPAVAAEPAPVATPSLSPASAPPPSVAPAPAPAPAAAPATSGTPAPAERRPGFRERGRMRRRLRYLRKVRELQARDLGGLVFDLRRFERKRDDLMAQKIDQIRACDDELRALETALDERRDVRDVREPGIGGTCPRCFALFGSTDRFCAHCGAALGGAAQGPAQVPSPPSS